jgi:arylsulfatase A-like enzyme
MNRYNYGTQITQMLRNADFRRFFCLNLNLSYCIISIIKVSMKVQKRMISFIRNSLRLGNSPFEGGRGGCSSQLNITKKISTLTSCIICIFLTVSTLQVFSQKPNRPKNIIIVLADDLGYGDLGCYGQKIIKTPNLDKLSKEGIKFTDFYSGSTVCAPSRCALLTGKDMGHATIRGNRETALPENETTIADVAKSAGYKTGMFGKWGLGNIGNEGSPERQNFDEFFGYLDHGHAHYFYTDHLFETKNGKTQKVTIDPTVHTSSVIFKKALNFIENHKNEPFLLYLPMTLPHAELAIPSAESSATFLNKEGKSIFVETPFVRGTGMSKTYHSQETPNLATAAMITQVDLDMGKLIAQIEKLGLKEDTYILFTSDNGPHDEGGRNIKQFDSSGGFRGFKRDLYEGGIRVPAIAWGGGIQPKTIKNITANWDILPTICEIVGKKIPENINGKSFKNLFLGKKVKDSHEFLYWEFHERGYDQAIRYKNFKAVKRSNNQLKMELYDIQTDPSESNDLANERPKEVEKIENLFKKARVESVAYPIKY